MATNNSSNFGTGTSGQVLTSTGEGSAPTFQNSTGGSAPGGGFGFPPWANLSVVTGGWSPTAYTVIAASSFSTNRTYLTPSVLSTGITITSISINCSTGAGTDSVRLGVYTMDTSANATLLADFGTISVNANGVFTISSLSTVLDAGYYYFAWNFSTAARNYSVVNHLPQILFFAGGTAYVHNNAASTFPASITAAQVGAGTASILMMGIKGTL
jgi:hypothetical protein